MRKGWRVEKSAWGLALLVAFVGASPPGPRQAPAASPIRMTVEVDWEVPPLPVLPPLARSPLPTPTSPPPVEVALTDGKILEILTASGAGPTQARGDGSWLAGSGTKGRARLRVEGNMGSELGLKVAGQTFRSSLGSLLEGPQRSAPKSGNEIGFERLPWDAIQVELSEPGSDGTVEPGAAVSLTLGFNVLTPEAASVNLRCLAELRPAQGGEPIWRQEWQEVVPTNVLEPAKHPLTITPRGPEGTYILEVKTSWEPQADPAGSRLGRWVRRRRNPSQTTSATRRLTLAVLSNSTPSPAAPSKAEGGLAAEAEVDAIDMTRPWGHRPSATGRSPLDGTGRSSWTVPELALVDATLRDRLRGWINRNGVEHSTLGAADSTGLAWSAVGLRVAHPDRPHRLTLTVTGGHPALLGVALVADGGAGGRGRVVLDASASGSPILEGAAPLTFSWPVWPDAEAPVLVLVNRSSSAPVQIGSVTLTELAELTPASPPRVLDRSIGLHLAGLRSLERFGGGDGSGRVDPFTQARNLSSYLAHCGASSVVLPEGLADRTRRKSLEGQGDEDATGPDRLDLLLRIMARRGMTAWVDVAFDAPLPGLPAPDSAEAWAEGLTRIDRRGIPDGPYYMPIHPRVRDAMAKKVAEAVAPRKTRANLAGVLIRLGPGSTLPGSPEMGLDDATFARFVDSVFEPGAASRVRGQGSSDPGRFEARVHYVEGAGKTPWLAWRSKEVAGLYTSLAREARRVAPGASLAVVTPGLEAGPVGDEARRVDLAGLEPSQGWRGVGLDLADWPTTEGSPIVIRGVGLSTDDLGHDLATSPELDDLVAARPGRGAFLGVEAIEPEPTPFRLSRPRLTACPMIEGTSGDEPLGHTLATLDPLRVLLSSTSVAGQEERIRRFARVFASLPASTTDPAPEAKQPTGVVARSIHSKDDTYLALANDTPYPILMEAVLQAPNGATVVDLGRGIRLEPEKGVGTIRLVLELAPYGVSGIQIGSTEVALVSVVPHASMAVIDGMKAHYDDLSLALKRLDRFPVGDPAISTRNGPANPGFEPEMVQLATSKVPSVVPGWESLGEPGTAEVDRDKPHSGRGSLRLDSKAGVSAVVSEPFRTDARSSLTIRTWLRADRADARIRVRIDGLAAGRPYARQLELPTPSRGDWAESIIRASQLPDGGLDSARLRFDLLGPGRLWVDDVSVVGDALSESERLNARRDLTAALSAYREKRYADFARLGGSHWARYVSSSPAPAIAGDRSGVIRTSETPSALPSSRRLR
jgi:hypothetical protein